MKKTVNCHKIFKKIPTVIIELVPLQLASLRVDHEHALLVPVVQMQMLQVVPGGRLYDVTDRVHHDVGGDIWWAGGQMVQ